MAESAAQNFVNHARWLPPYHFVAGPILFVYFMMAVWGLTTGVTWPAILQLLFAVGLLLFFLYARLMVTTVQDRVVRLEERLRMGHLLPAAMQSRIGEFTVAQLVALRFASDEELPALAERVLREGIVDGKTIKGMITVWRPDYLRA